MGERKFIRKVTITGVDEKTDLERLQRLAEQFPFAEWAVLLSKSSAGTKPRYPSRECVDRFINCKVPSAGHLCGAWLRDFVDGGSMFEDERPGWLRSFDRIQLNIGHRPLSQEIFLKVMSRYQSSLKDSFQRFIIQVQQYEVPDWYESLGNNIDLLFDNSGGQGVEQASWTRPPLIYLARFGIGYAGGLTPQNLSKHIALLADLKFNLMIDAESGIRTDDVFDLDKVTTFLQIAAPYVL